MDDHTAEDIVIRLSQIFEPHWRKKRKAIHDEKGSFVHYTSAENAWNIISKAELWLRSARCMNDYSEMSFGRSLLLETIDDGAIFSGLIETVGKKNMKKALHIFNGFWKNLYNNTFIACISEHEDPEDNKNDYGKLSMWRAYGERSAKAAIVLNIPFDEPVTGRGSGVALRPVMYFDKKDLRIELDKITAALKQEHKFISSLPDGRLPLRIAQWLLIASVCLKHPGFKEEKEWRAIYFALNCHTNPLPNNVEMIQGIPQIVYKLKLEANPEKGLGWIDVPDLVDKIIIGPTQYPDPIVKAFEDALHKAGVANPEERIAVSNLPLRT